MTTAKALPAPNLAFSHMGLSVKDIVRESRSRRAANWPIGTCR